MLAHSFLDACTSLYRSSYFQIPTLYLALGLQCKGECNNPKTYLFNIISLSSWVHLNWSMEKWSCCWWYLMSIELSWNPMLKLTIHSPQEVQQPPPPQRTTTTWV